MTGNKHLFQKGNKLGNRFTKDNQPAIKGRKQSNLSTLLNEGCTKADLLEIFKTQIQKAKDGDNDSAKLVLSYIVGKPETFSFGDESDSGTRIQQNILNVFANPDNLTNSDLLNILTAEKQEIIPIETE